MFCSVLIRLPPPLPLPRSCHPLQRPPAASRGVLDAAHRDFIQKTLPHQSLQESIKFGRAPSCLPLHTSAAAPPVALCAFDCLCPSFCVLSVSYWDTALASPAALFPSCTFLPNLLQITAGVSGKRFDL